MPADDADVSGVLPDDSPAPALQVALRHAAPVVGTAGVVERVAGKRARRRTVRRLEAAGIAVVLLVAIGVTAVAVGRNDGPATHVAAPGTALTARVVPGSIAAGISAGHAETPQPVSLDADEGYVRGPLFVSSTGLSLAAYDRTGNSFSFPPSRIVRVDRDGHVTDRIDLKAEIVSVTEGEGARWAVTQNPPNADGVPPDLFFKRLGPDGSVRSVQMNPRPDIAGPIAAFGGAVWIPVREGLQQFDTEGAFVRTIPLAPAASRSIAEIGKSGWVTDGPSLRRLDPSRGVTSDVRSVVSGPILAATGDALNGWLLTGPHRIAFVDPNVRVTGGVTLPSAFSASTVTNENSRTWVTGTVDGFPAIVLLQTDGRVRDTVILQNGSDATLAWTDAGTVTAVSGGDVFHIPLG